MRSFATALLAAWTTIALALPALSQGSWTPPAAWPKAPDDWIEFAPGTTDNDYSYNYLSYLSPAARAGAKPNKGFDLREPIPAWMNKLERPNLPTQKCCGPADAYEVEILEDGGESSQWAARITRGEARQYPDGTFRPAIPNGTIFHVRPERVTKPAQGNPTETAWLFAAVSWHTVSVYCLVPLPPSF